MEPTKVILKAAQRTLKAVDAKGRSVVFRRPTALDTLRLFKSAGPVLSQNECWLAMASLAFSVEEIDGVPVPSPSSETQIEALVDRLGDEGLSAIAVAIGAQSEQVDIGAQVGNSLGTLS